MSWATLSDVATYTNITTASSGQLEQAQAIVELFADTTELASDAGNISERNLRLLKMAVAYQTAWLTAHPDAFLNIDITSMNQDGLSATFAHSQAGVLAPLAKKCIDRLSWKRNRTIRVRRGFTSPRTNDYDSTARDDNRKWTPLY